MTGERSTRYATATVREEGKTRRLGEQIVTFRGQCARNQNGLFARSRAERSEFFIRCLAGRRA